jgi:hypothetical protein
MFTANLVAAISRLLFVRALLSQVGGLAEDHGRGTSVGPLFTRILVDQFTRLRDGDRFWYENVLTGAALTSVRATTLADMLRRNTALRNIQDNVFVFRTGVTGTVVGDANGDGRVQTTDPALAGATVTLTDAVTSAVVRSTSTDSTGQLGVYARVCMIGVMSERGVQATARKQSPCNTSCSCAGEDVLSCRLR